jgi:hypothetical protein
VIKFLGRTIVILALIIVGATAIRGFVQAHSETKAADDDDAESPLKVAPRVSNVDGVPTITLDADVAKRSEIETAKLTNAPHAQMLRAYGSVLNLQSLTDLANRYAGAKAEIETQQAKRDLSEANIERSRALYGQGEQAISKAQLEAAEEALRIDEVALVAAKSQLDTLVHSAIQAWGDVLGNAIIGPSPLLSNLIERRLVLIQVTLRADESLAKPPQQAFLTTQSGERIALDYVSAAAATDPHFQGESFFYTAPARSSLLPGMNVIAFVPTGESSARVEIPTSAIVWLQGRAWAYFQTGEKTFVRHEVATDSPAPDGGYFINDVADGTAVVVRGAQMLLSEEFRAQIQTEE